MSPPLPPMDEWPERDLCDDCSEIVIRPVCVRNGRYCKGCAKIRRRVIAATEVRGPELAEIERAVESMLEGSTEYTA